MGADEKNFVRTYLQFLGIRKKPAEDDFFANMCYNELKRRLNRGEVQGDRWHKRRSAAQKNSGLCLLQG